MNEPLPTTVSRYLDEVDALLRDLPDEDRQETLSGLREHIEASLGPRPDRATVQRVIDELGDPLEIAAAAHRGTEAPNTGVMRRPPAFSSRRWLPVTVLTVFALMSLFVVFMFAGFSAVVSSGSSTEPVVVGAASQSRPHLASDLSDPVRTRSITTKSSSELHVQPSAPVIAAEAMTALPFFVLVALLVGVSRLWTTPEKVRLLGVLPALLVLSAVLPWGGFHLARDTGFSVGSGAWLLFVLLAVGLVAVLSRRAWRRADLLLA